MDNTSRQVDDYLDSLEGWQKGNLVHFRNLIHEVDPSIKEAWKWSVPVFLSSVKMVCAMSTFKNHTKYNFFEGASLSDEYGLFNSGLDSKKHRSINLAAGELIDDHKLKTLIEEAVHKVKSP